MIEVTLNQPNNSCLALLLFTMLIFLDIVGMMDSMYNLLSILVGPDMNNNGLEKNSTMNSESSCMWMREAFEKFCDEDPLH